MAQNKAQANELARQATAPGGHSIKSAVGGTTDMSEDVLEMAVRLVRGLLRCLVHSAGSVASRSGDASGEAGGD